MIGWFAGAPETNFAKEPPAITEVSLPTTPPPGAVVLLAQDGSHRFVSMAGDEIDWPIENGALISSGGGGRKSSNHVVSQYHFRDAQLHVEFMLPAEGAGNSGIYLHGNFEIQILNAGGGGEEMGLPTDKEIGAIYGFNPPLQRAARPAGEWQIYDIKYTAPHRNPQGVVVEKGRISVWLNGILVQDKFEVGEPRSKYHPYRYGTTSYLRTLQEVQRRTSVGPVFLQDHSSPVRFRNVWVLPLDETAHFYQP